MCQLCMKETNSFANLNFQVIDINLRMYGTNFSDFMHKSW